MRAIVFLLVNISSLCAVCCFGAAHIALWGPILQINILSLVLAYIIYSKGMQQNQILQQNQIIIAICLFFSSLCLQVLWHFFEITTSIVSPLVAEKTFTFPIPLSTYNYKVSLYQYLLPITIFLSLLLVQVNRKEANTLLLVIIAANTTQAVLGIGQYFDYNINSLFPNFNFEGKILGTFLNRNTYAISLAMAVPLTLAITLNLYQAQKNYIAFTRKQVLKILFFIFLVIVIMGGVIASKSRSGLVLLGIGTTIFLLLRSYTMQRKEFGKSCCILGLFIAILILLLYLLGEGYYQRFLILERDYSGGRYKIFREALIILKDHWLLGCGGGCYMETRELYNFGGSIRYIHNDFLQLFVEYGVFSAIAFLYLLFIYIKSIAVIPRSNKMKNIWCGCCASFTVIFCHAIVDFSLQIPAIRIQLAIIASVWLSTTVRENCASNSFYHAV